LVNKGFASATKIEIEDRYDPNSFLTKSNINENGTVSFFVEELAPGKTLALNVTVAPKLYGLYESTRARIKYNAGTVIIEDAEEDIRRGLSTSLGRVKIISKQEYLRSTASKTRELVVLIVAALAWIIAPYAVWRNANNVAKAILGKKKA
jgi:hypothetical protein